MKYLILALLLVSCGRTDVSPQCVYPDAFSTPGLHEECWIPGAVTCGDRHLLRCRLDPSAGDPPRFIWTILIECRYDCLATDPLVCG